MGRRAASKEHRIELRAKILEVSTELFRERGFRAVKMDEVSQLLGISKRTLYEIYPNKEDLVFEVFRSGIMQMREKLRQCVNDGDDTMDILIEFFRQQIAETERVNPVIVGDLQAYPKIKQFFEQYKADNAQMSMEFLQKGQKEGYFRKDINFAIVNIIYRTISDSITSNPDYRNFQPLELLETLVALFARGLCTSKGVRRIDNMLKSLKQ